MKFILNETLRMREIRQAESSNTAAMDLMGRFAHDDNGVKMEPAEFIAIVDEMDMLQFAQLYVQFLGSAVPKANGTR